MKIFLINIASLLPEHARAAQTLSKDHDILYWVRLEDVFPLDHRAFPNTVFHDYREALKGIPPSGLGIAAPPWSAREIAEFYETESEVLPMMDKWYPDWPILKRKDFYYDLLRYWGGVLDRLSPECIIFHAPPHEIFTFVLYRLAKARGIKTSMFDCILKQDRVILSRDYKEGNKALARAAADGFANGPGSKERLSEEMRHYFEEVSEAPNPAPAYVEGWKVEALGWGKVRRRSKALLPFIKDGTIFERAALRFFKLFKEGVRGEHRKYERHFDAERSYVYAPLHYQPECTTSPQGGIFVDQILMLKMLSAALPRGWEIYVKEHPAQVQAHGNDYTPFRYRDFFKEVAAIPHVRLIPIDTNTFRLTEKAKAVATVSGTAGWEGVLRGTPALVFGYPWFMHAPGITRVSSVEECAEALQNIDSGFLPDKEKLFNYLAAVEAASFRGYTSGYGKKVATYSEEEAVREMHRALEAALST